jgi:hypothetical protein
MIASALAKPASGYVSVVVGPFCGSALTTAYFPFAIVSTIVLSSSGVCA